MTNARESNTVEIDKRHIPESKLYDVTGFHLKGDDSSSFFAVLEVQFALVQFRWREFHYSFAIRSDDRGSAADCLFEFHQTTLASAVADGYHDALIHLDAGCRQYRMNVRENFH